MQKKSTSFY